jgi:hypothetical protein
MAIKKKRKLFVDVVVRTARSASTGTTGEREFTYIAEAFRAPVGAMLRRRHEVLPCHDKEREHEPAACNA